jgi:glyoxylase-like metal-dependent hydrolase (beta-lactamase superfamily II)
VFETIAEGVHRIEDAHVNWYLIEDGDGLTVVDTGLPRSWGSLQAALHRLGRTAGEIDAVVLTHGHFDHVGFADRARRELGVGVWAPHVEQPLVAHPWNYDHEKPRLEYALRHPGFDLIFLQMGLMGALWVKGVDDVIAYEPGQTLDVPGHPQAIDTAGHTYGHCSLLLADRGVLLAGDAVVTFDPYIATAGPQIVSRAATADSARALRSLEAIAATGAEIVGTGHGPTWRQGAGALAERAHAAGVS